MSINRPQVTVVGNLTSDPELRFTGNGTAVCKVRILSTPRFLDKTTNEWKDGEPFGIDATVWREFAENVAESLQKGARVVATGELAQRQYEDKEGNKRTAWDLQVDAIGPDLRYATTVVTKKSKGNGGGGGSPADDEWAGASRERPATAAAASVRPVERNAPVGQPAASPADDW